MPNFLAPIINEQQIDSNGDPLNAGTISINLAGSSTPVVSYSDQAGAIPNTSPILLNTLGINSQGAIWLPGGAAYKFVILNEFGVVQRTIDNVSGINDTTVTTDQWLPFSGTPTYISATSFSVGGDQTPTLQIGRRIKTVNTGGTVYSTIISSVYGAPNTTVTVQSSNGVLDAGLSQVSYGLLSPSDGSVPFLGSEGATSSRNRIINGAFKINQRAVSGAVVLAAGAYGHDRWKAGTGGCSYTFATSGIDTVLTITAGSLIQVVEGATVEGGSYALSWFGTSAGKIGAGSTGVSGLTGTGTAGANLNIEFGVGTLSRVQLEPGVVGTPFERRPLTLEFQLCRRYFLQYSQGAFYSSGFCYSTSQAAIGFAFPSEMRTAPSIVASLIGLLNSSAGTVAAVSATLGTVGTASCTVNVTVGGTPLIAGNGTMMVGTGGASFIAFNAEL